MQDKKKNGVVALLRRIFSPKSKQPASEHQTDYQALGHASGGLEAEYQRLVEHHLRRWGVGEHCAQVEIQQIEQRKGRREVFVATIVLSAWDRNGVLRVLLGLPMLDKKVREAVSALWLADVSAFQGVLLKVTPALQEAPATTELRHLLVSLTGSRAPGGRRSGDGVPLVH
ncbi:hypothetical protein H8N03_19830 [Ramlibacter sp. USB13]|uniref:Uncharacterized protein n=1 Tax=Ramlibacter cellulosilyticus TaxID=2764187 RepID=A0A923MSW2_9BURK|nr:hypothetical protein [Ramlibacter cellulosilyticus]MBC5785207.1 hypothetical protein [Ramlibacter cellulosilyticus]